MDGYYSHLYLKFILKQKELHIFKLDDSSNVLLGDIGDQLPCHTNTIGYSTRRITVVSCPPVAAL
jgi:hypothetical protein